MKAAPPARCRYVFGEFTLSPSRRVLLRGLEERPLIPRYFDLLLLLVARRQEAVHRREIFDTVWHDVVVSDSALTQAVRIIRRTLGDDPREPRFIRTVSRHGYRFVFSDVLEEPDLAEATPVPVGAGAETANGPHEGANGTEAALALLLRAEAAGEDESVRREAAELLHQRGLQEALDRLRGVPGHERARAYLRDARWDVPGAAPVPILGSPGGLRTLAILFALRLRRGRSAAAERWLAAVLGGAAAGLLLGTAGGAVLWLGPGSSMTATVPAVLGLVGATAGGVAAAGVAAGLLAAEMLVRSWRRAVLSLFGALGGALIGGLGHLLGRWTVQELFGRDLSPVGGGFEGLVIGAAIGFGYALGAPRAEGGMATPRGRARGWAALVTGGAAALAGMALAATGSHLGAMSLDFMTRSFPGSNVTFDPLARLLGETTPGPLTRIAIGAGEGLGFGFGLAWGLTRRPRN